MKTNYKFTLAVLAGISTETAAAVAFRTQQKYSRLVTPLGPC